MDINDNQRNGELEDQFEDSPENSGDAPLSAVSNDVKMASSSCSKISKRTMEKRVVSVPIREIEGFRLKGDHMSAPPSDSWAWRKYGQKPIKGSPYPRGYYRCSSSKVCPARKQVERSRVDPEMLMVTYSCEHNHSSPASKNNNQNHSNHRSNTSAAAATDANATTSVSVEPAEMEEEKKPINHLNRAEKYSEEKFTSLVEVPQITASHEFVWLNDFESASCSLLESSILREDKISTDKEMGVAFTMGEEEESLFADLDELPECSIVFRHGLRQSVEEQRQHSLVPWCDSTWDV